MCTTGIVIRSSPRSLLNRFRVSHVPQLGNCTLSKSTKTSESSAFAKKAGKGAKNGWQAETIIALICL